MADFTRGAKPWISGMYTAILIEQQGVYMKAIRVLSITNIMRLSVITGFIILASSSTGCNKGSGSSAGGAQDNSQTYSAPDITMGVYDGIDSGSGLAYISLFGANLTATGATNLAVSSSCAAFSTTQGTYVVVSPTQINASFTLPAQQQPGCNVTISYSVGSSNMQATIPINIPGSASSSVQQNGLVCTFALNYQMGNLSVSVGTNASWQITTNAAVTDTLTMTVTDAKGPITGYTDVPASQLLSNNTGGIDGPFQQVAVSATPYNRSIVVTDQTTGQTCITNTLYVTVTAQ